MRFINFHVYLSFLCVGVLFTVVYAMPFQPDPSSTPHPQVARANAEPPLLATLTFVESHSGAAISGAPPTGFVLSSSRDARQHAIIKTPGVFTRLQKAVESLVPPQDKNRVVLAFKNRFQASSHKKDVFKVFLLGIGECLNGCWFDVDKNGNVVENSMQTDPPSEKVHTCGNLQENLASSKLSFQVPNLRTRKLVICPNWTPHYLGVKFQGWASLRGEQLIFQSFREFHPHETVLDLLWTCFDKLSVENIQIKGIPVYHPSHPLSPNKRTELLVRSLPISHLLVKEQNKTKREKREKRGKREKRENRKEKREKRKNQYLQSCLDCVYLTLRLSLTQPPIESTATGTITFLGPHSGVPLLPHESPKISTAYEEGHIPSDVYKRVRKAVQEVVPEWDAERGGVLAFSNSFEGSVGTVGGMSSGGSRNGAGARGRVVQYGVIEEWEGGARFTCSSQLISSLPSNLLLPTIQNWGKKEKTQVNHAQKSGVLHSRLVTTAGVEPAIS
ncbi:hypothetical protein GG344DRAFT_69017 [Lentinula edodes]|nr:hypothetical protein GG344DRAFT_69017 [Lentinula edodes]